MSTPVQDRAAPLTCARARKRGARIRAGARASAANPLAGNGIPPVAHRLLCLNDRPHHARMSAHPYDEMTAPEPGRPAPLPGVRRLARAHRRDAHCAEARGGGARVPSRRHHVRGVRRRRRNRTPHSVRHRSAHHSGGRVDRARARAEAARARAQSVSRRRLSRAAHPEGRRDSRRARARQRAIPARDGRHGRAGRHLCAHRGRRHRARGRRASTTCSRTTCACRRACRTCSRTAR